MKKKITTLTLGALGIVSLAAACSVEAVDAPQEQVGTSSEGLVCANHQAVHSLMSILAVNISDELGRWMPEAAGKQGDFKFNYSTGAIELTSTGNTRCANWPTPATSTNCAWLKSNLKFMSWAKHGQVLAGAVLDFNSVQSRFAAAWGRQDTCMGRPDNGFPDNCPVETHDLVFSSLSNPPTSCATDYWYHAYKSGTTQPLAKPAQLANMLIWAGWGPGERNPWIAFDTQGDDVKLDPGMGYTDGNPVPMTSGGVALVRFHYQGTPKYSIVVSPFENITGRSCKADPDNCVRPAGQVCPPATRAFQPSDPANPDGTYKCL